MGWKITITDIETRHSREQVFAVDAVRIGRDSGNEISLDHPRISRVHITLALRDGRAYLTDSSRNGTLLKTGGLWLRMHQEVGLIPPVDIVLPGWLVNARPETPVPAPEQAQTQVWDQSVMIPAGHLKQIKEAILVFDLCESSRLASDDDHMAWHLKQRLNQLAEPLLESHGRRFYKNTGDGFLCTFELPARALAAAVELEQRIRHRNERTTNPPIHYRLALHFGETWVIGAGDIHGHDVNVAFRIEGVQAPAFGAAVPADLPARDRILCSADFLAEIDRALLPAGCRGFRELGPAQLKGIGALVSIQQVLTDALQEPM